MKGVLLPHAGQLERSVIPASYLVLGSTGAQRYLSRGFSEERLELYAVIASVSVFS